MQVPKNVFMFSGQGSQYFDMGKDLYDSSDTFRDWMLKLDETAKGTSGRSVVDTLYSEGKGKADPFDRTLMTHPAIFMVEYSLAQALMQAGIKPDMVLGASLGSFAAAAVAGMIDVEDAMTAVMRQALAFEECCEPGGMTAVLADPGLFKDDFMSSRSELAAVNFDSHFVVSAKQAELAEIEGDLKQKSIAFQRLPVSFAFHSQWIDKAKDMFETFVRSMKMTAGQMPLVCCDRTTTMTELAADYFWGVVRHPIRFRETTSKLEQQGPCRYIDVGPAGTLATFLKYGLPATTKSTVHSILTPFGRDRKNMAALMEMGGH